MGHFCTLWATSVRTRAISAERIRSKGPTKHIQSIMTTAPWLELKIVNNFIPKNCTKLYKSNVTSMYPKIVV